MKNVVAAFPLWFALAGALAEVAILYFKKRQDPLMLLSPDYVWMAPLALLIVIFSVVTLTGVVAGRWRTRTVDGVRLFVPLTLVALNLLMLIPGLAHWAAAILAAGIAVQLSRVVLARPESTSRLVRRTTGWILGGVVLSGALIWNVFSHRVSAPVVRDRASQPNLVLITLDTVRAANMSLSEIGRQTTPNIARYAKEKGVVFNAAFSTAPWTLPSHASMFTGRWPHELSVDYETPLDATYPTLAEYLRDRGYATGGFVGNLKYCGTSSGLARGFSVYRDYPRSVGQVAASSTLVRTVADNFRLRRLIENDQHLNRVSAEEITNRALDWILTQGQAPFFAFMNYFDAHEPYLPPAPFDRQFGPGRAERKHSPLHHWLWNPAVRHQTFADDVRQEEIDAYDGSLAYLDAEVGRFLDTLERQGILENTLVVITSDHGEEFGEHGVYEHGYSLYATGVRVPLIILEPGNRLPFERALYSGVSDPVSLRNIPATVVELLHAGEDSPFPGTSMATLWGPRRLARGSMGPAPVLMELAPSPGQPEWFPSSKGEMKSIVYERWRYIRNGDGSEELYDMDPSHDPWERHNLATLPERQQDLVEARALLERVLNGGS